MNSNQSNSNLINIKIKLESNDHKALDLCVRDLIIAIKKENLEVIGPIPVINRNIKFAVRRAPNIYKVSFERFQMSIHSRIFFIKNISSASRLKFIGQLSIPKIISIKVNVIKNKNQQQQAVQS